MKKIYFIAVALALAACSNDDDNYVDEPVAVQISATIGQSAVSRASETSWSNGDRIGITMANLYANLEYTTESGDGKFIGTTMYFRNKRESVTFTAYYPFTGNEGTATPVIEASTTADKQTSANQSGIDFLHAVKENVTGIDPNVTFTFSHQMSKLTLIFKNGTGVNGIKIASYEIDGLILQGTFNTATGVCAAKTGASPELLDITMSGEADDVSLLLFPQATAGKNVTLKITDSDGQDYACTLSFEGNEIVSGNNYQFTITVNKTGLNVNQSTITDWVSKPSSCDASSVVTPNK